MSPARDATIRDLNDCDCCGGIGASTPVEILNRPGLGAIAYRVGTHATFKASMLAALSDSRRAALGAFNTREDDDFTIALLDAWASVADVIAFYQERIANESYLRSATERRSVLELARTIGYELAPGVAASTWLAFTVEDGGGAPLSATGIPPVVTIPIGTAAQSIPGQDELPQDYETVEPIEARAEWNEMVPRVARPEELKPRPGVLYLQGTETGLSEGDALVIIGPEREANPASAQWAFRRVRSAAIVEPANPSQAYTEVSLDAGVPAFASATVHALRKRAALFGSNAPDWKAMPKSLKASVLNRAETGPFPEAEWPGFTLADMDIGTGLLGEYYGAEDFTDHRFTRVDHTIYFDMQDGGPDPSMPVNRFSIRWTGQILPKVSGLHTFRVHADDGVRLWIGGTPVLDEWRGQHTTFTRTIDLTAGVPYDIRLDYFDHDGGAIIGLIWSAPGLPMEVVPSQRLYPGRFPSIYLDAIYPDIFSGSWTVLSTPEWTELHHVDSVADSAQARFALTSKSTRLTLSGANLLAKFNNRIRDTVVHAVSEELKRVDEPIDVPITDTIGGVSIELEGAVAGLHTGQRLALSGFDDATGAPSSEVATVDEAIVRDSYTEVKLLKNLTRPFRRAGLVINANVAPATNGQTKAEVLGSGDASLAFQRFTLSHVPLTYVSADNPAGAASTLQVRVNGVLWLEAPTLHGRGAREHVYITRADEGGNVTVIFGDGRNGARLPTGIENVSAVYRMGIGIAAEAEAGQISLLMSAPLGVAGVINPVAATGAADPQAPDDARRNAPRTVLTLERIVSLRDFEDFAAAFAGIGKALATWTWNRNRRGVLITVAGAHGEDVPPGSRLHDSLLAAIVRAGDPHIPVRLESYRRRTFTIRGRVAVDPLHLVEKVAVAVEAALRSRFSFDARAFGQRVNLSEVVAVIQDVPGVRFVDVDEIRRTDGSDNLTPLAADSPRPGSASTVEAAELLTITPDPLNELEVTRWVSI